MVAFISARSAEFQKLMRSGRSRQLFTHFEYIEYARVSDVGLSASRSPITLPPECVTQNTSGSKPAKCSFSLLSNDSGMSTGRKPLRTPAAANFASSDFLTASHIE